jgi:hypothetical protein
MTYLICLGLLLAPFIITEIHNFLYSVWYDTHTYWANGILWILDRPRSIGDFLFGKISVKIFDGDLPVIIPGDEIEKGFPNMQKAGKKMRRLELLLVGITTCILYCIFS